ncbi:MAG TPA: DUF1194 domain-containing protein [Amaricoccus sp.]|jgi:hypothetical protein|nr:DUF1194 domain-containing protein [Amaricoccus sp.]
MRWRWLAVALTLAAIPAGAQQPVEVDAKIVLAVDVSRSMDLGESAVQREGYLAALRHPDLARAIAAGARGRVAIAYFEWAGQVQDGGLVPWRVIDGPVTAAALADEIAGLPVRRARGTSISRAIAFATVLLEDDQIAGARRVIDVSGDGANNIGPIVTGSRDAAVAKGITVNGLPILALGGGAPPNLDLYYQDCVVGGDGAFVMVARERADLARTIRRKLVLEISGLPPPPAIVPAQLAATDCLMGERSFGRWNR